MLKAGDFEHALGNARPSLSQKEQARLTAIYTRFRGARLTSAGNVAADAKGKRSTLA